MGWLEGVVILSFRVAFRMLDRVFRKLWGKGSLPLNYTRIGIRKYRVGTNISTNINMIEWILGWESVQLAVVLLIMC